MKERPILFSAPMVRALLDGTKTQTRRIVKPQADARTTAAFQGADGIWRFSYPTARAPVSHADWDVRCPYGMPGDRLWVRETCFINDYRGVDVPVDERADCNIVYKADPLPDFEGEENLIVWRPSIHMPRWASRIDLENVSVRVERLENITEADALAEGVDMNQLVTMPMFPGAPCTVTIKPRSAIEAYAMLWESINGPGSWHANPWVWAVEFKAVNP